jgi:hypothetical protein
MENQGTQAPLNDDDFLATIVGESATKMRTTEEAAKKKIVEDLQNSAEAAEKQREIQDILDLYTKFARELLPKCQYDPDGNIIPRKIVKVSKGPVPTQSNGIAMNVEIHVHPMEYQFDQMLKNPHETLVQFYNDHYKLDIKPLILFQFYQKKATITSLTLDVIALRVEEEFVSKFLNGLLKRHIRCEVEDTKTTMKKSAGITDYWDIKTDIEKIKKCISDIIHPLVFGYTYFTMFDLLHYIKGIMDKTLSSHTTFINAFNQLVRALMPGSDMEKVVGFISENQGKSGVYEERIIKSIEKEMGKPAVLSMAKGARSLDRFQEEFQSLRFTSEGKRTSKIQKKTNDVSNFDSFIDTFNGIASQPTSKKEK